MRVLAERWACELALVSAVAMALRAPAKSTCCCPKVCAHRRQGAPLAPGAQRILRRAPPGCGQLDTGRPAAAHRGRPGAGLACWCVPGAGAGRAQGWRAVAVEVWGAVDLAFARMLVLRSRRGSHLGAPRRLGAARAAG